MDELFLLGRILLGGYFLKNAYAHYAQRVGFAAYAKSKGVPSPMLAVLGSGVLLLIGGLSVLLGAYVAWGVLALALFLIPVTFTMHAYWKDTDPMTKMINQVNFWKNLALLGAALCLLAIPQPWMYSL